LTIKQDKQYQILGDITAEVSRVVIGKEDLKELLLIALLSQGHVLIEGLPGTAKTTLARTFARVIGGKFKRVQGTPDMLPADILGFYLYRPDGSSTFMPGPIFANVILADELNRTTPRTQAALLEAMQEQQVTIERETHPLEQPFIVIASQVPHGSTGTSPLSDVQIDRFMLRIWSGFPESHEEEQILRDINQISTADVSPVATLTDIIQLQQDVKNIHVSDSVRHYIVAILDRLRQHEDLLLGPSPRGSIALLRGARALAYTQGRDFVIPDDVKRLLVPALCHRLRISTEAEMEEVIPEAIINKVASEVPVPKEGTVSKIEETSEVKREAPEAPATATAEANEVAEEASEAPAGTPDTVDIRAEEAHQETATEAESLPTSIEQAQGTVEGSALKMLTQWEWALILFALVAAVIMICVGLLSIR